MLNTESAARYDDNIATSLAPVWRRRVRAPLTPWAVRMDLITQAMEMPDYNRERFISRRLTVLDRALSDFEAIGLEEWLLCADLLSGRAKICSYGDRSGGNGGGPQPIPDTMLARVHAHVLLTSQLPRGERTTLDMLAGLMASPDWDLGHAGYALYGAGVSYHRAKRWFVLAVKVAARTILRLSESPCFTNSKQL
jgi:hypothetical protein